MFTSPGYQAGRDVVAGGGPVAVGGRFGLGSLLRLARNPAVRRGAYRYAQQTYPRATRAAAAAARGAATAGRKVGRAVGRVKSKAGAVGKRLRRKKKTSTSTALVPRTFTGTSARTPMMNRVTQAARRKLRQIHKNIRDPKKRKAAMLAAIREVGKGGVTFGTTAGIAAAVDAISNGKSVSAQDMRDITQNAGVAVMQDALKGKKMTASRMSELVQKEARKQIQAKPSQNVSTRRQLAALGLQQLEKILLKRYSDFGRKMSGSGRQHRIITQRGGGGKRRRRPKKRKGRKGRRRVTRLTDLFG